MIDFDNEDVFDRLKAMTGGRGPDACIDAVGLEAHGADARRLRRQGQDGGVPGDRSAERAAPGDSRLPQGRHRLDSRRLRRASRQDAVRSGVPEGADVQDGADPHDEVHAAAARRASSAATSIRRSSSRTACRSTMPPQAYKMFRDKQDECIKVVLKPHGETVH